MSILNLNRRPLALLEMDFGSRSAERLSALDPQDKFTLGASLAARSRTKEESIYEKASRRLSEARSHFFSKVAMPLSHSFGEAVSSIDKSFYGVEIAGFRSWMNEKRALLADSSKPYSASLRETFRSILRDLSDGYIDYVEFFKSITSMKNEGWAESDGAKEDINRLLTICYEAAAYFLLVFGGFGDSYVIRESLNVNRRRPGEGLSWHNGLIVTIPDSYPSGFSPVFSIKHAEFYYAIMHFYPLREINREAQERGFDGDALFGRSGVIEKPSALHSFSKSAYRTAGLLESVVKKAFGNFATRAEEAVSVFLAEAFAF